jgi:hypothetical protein
LQKCWRYKRIQSFESGVSLIDRLVCPESLKEPLLAAGLEVTKGMIIELANILRVGSIYSDVLKMSLLAGVLEALMRITLWERYYS